MIVSRLSGGLGNQLFQYSLGRHVALRHGTRLCIEMDRLRSRPHATPRDYQLGMFSIDVDVVSMEQISRQSDLVSHVVQFKRGYHQSVLNATYAGSVVLEGVWTSELYFADIASIIRNELSFKTATFEFERHDLVGQIESTNSVCVHIRRGDYLLGRHQFLGVLDWSYYRSALEYVSSHLMNPHVFVFSDDIDWCAQHLEIDITHTLVAHRTRPSEATEEDLRLMTRCRHFVIANSTFSWWAAWLGGRAGLVVAPRRWFNPAVVGEDASEPPDVIPARWMRL